MDNTARLLLQKPNPDPVTGDFLDVSVLNSNFDKIDAALGATPCTSATRPSSPYRGQFALETDTGWIIVCTSTGPAVWKYVFQLQDRPGPLTCRKSSEVENRNTVLLADPQLRITTPAATGRYTVQAMIWYRSTTNADFKMQFTHPNMSMRWSADAPSMADATKSDYSLVFDTSTLAIAGTGSFARVFIQGVASFNVSGDFIFNWGQNVLDAASSTLVLNESWIRLTPIAH